MQCNPKNMSFSLVKMAANYAIISRVGSLIAGFEQVPRSKFLKFSHLCTSHLKPSPLRERGMARLLSSQFAKTW